MGLGAERKKEYFTQLLSNFDNHKSVVIVSADNVGSAHLQSLRKEFRPLNAQMMMGKNTLIRRALNSHLEAAPQLAAVLPYVKGNIGFIFCTQDTLPKVVEICRTNRVGAAAKAGTPAPKDVIVPAGPTGMEPTMTSFLQALNIATKINRGQIEIIKEVELIKAGQKVGNSEASLLQKLGIRPFDYGLQVEAVYDDGACFDPSLLELTDDVVAQKFTAGVRNIACISLALGFPTAASVPHSLMNGYKNVIAVALATGYTYPQVEELKERIENPGAFAAAAAPAAAAGGDAPAKKEEAKEEEPEESSEEMGFDMFG